MVAIGHLIGYGVGALDLGRIFGTIIGDSQFKQLCVIAAAALIFAVGVTSWAVAERVLVLSEYVSPLDELPSHGADMCLTENRPPTIVEPLVPSNK